MKKLLVALLSIPLLAGCSSGGGGGGDNDAQVGYLTYSGIRGLNYQTASQSGVTGTRGEFRYYPGETITFTLGDLVIAEDIPAKYRLSPLDLDPSLNELLFQSTVVNGLSTHSEVEAQAVQAAHGVINKLRLLASLDRDKNFDTGIFITDDIITQLTQVQVDEPIDFNQPRDLFGENSDIHAPENRFVWSLCFPEESEAICDSPTRGRTITNSLMTTEYIYKELNRTSNEIGADIQLYPFAFEIPAADSGIRTVKITMGQFNRDIAELEVVSMKEDVLHVQSLSRDEKEFSFFVTSTAQSGDRAEIIANIRLEGDYRWHPKSLSVVIR